MSNLIYLMFLVIIGVATAICTCQVVRQVKNKWAVPFMCVVQMTDRFERIGMLILL